MRGTVRNEPRDLEFQAEMEEHVRLLAERYRRQGMTPEAAMLAARRQFGNTALVAGGPEEPCGRYPPSRCCEAI